MTTFVYRCPMTGFKVQGFRSDDLRPASPSTEEVYETVTCTACRSVHLVNPLTGHVAGGHSKTER